MKIMKRLTLVASLALFVAAVAAAPASAMKWSGTGFSSLKGTLTLKKGGASPVNCTVSTSTHVAEPEPGLLELEDGFYITHTTTCANGLNWEWTNLFSAIEEELESGKAPVCCFHGPESYEGPVPWTGVKYFVIWPELTMETWLNGSKTTPSYIEFNEANIGRTNGGQAVTATGKLEIKRGTENLYIIP